MRFGLLLPHFGAQTDHSRLFGMGPRLEKLGFHSAWTRDHLGYSGGLSFERGSTHFVDPLITMAAIAATSRLTVGTATLTPFRQPVVLAQMIGSLSYLAQGRIALGVGLGKSRAMELAGYVNADRGQLFEDMVGVLRACGRRDAAFEGHHVSFDDLTIDPGPPEDLPLWYCGVSEAALRRAVAYTDGWMPGRCPFPVFDRFHQKLKERAGGANKQMSVAIVPLLSMGRDRRQALSRVNVEGLLDTFRNKRPMAADGPFDSAEDLHGAVIAGNAQDVLEDLAMFKERGVDEIVFDLRESMEVFDETIDQLGEEILPVLS